MADRSKIEWTDASWNPIRARGKETGKIGWHCEHVSPGCAHCYAESINQRLGTGLEFKPGHQNSGEIEIFLDENMLTRPLRWRKPRKIFIGSMTDLFARFVTKEMLDRIFTVIALTPQHTYQVVTKRADRMRDYCVRTSRNTINGHIWSMLGTPEGSKIKRSGNWQVNWPLPNVWLGVSAERQDEADERIPLLLQAPAAVRFVSLEPLLGPINLASINHCGVVSGHSALHDRGLGQLDWVIVGGESGPGARSMHPEWARSLRDQCAAASVPFFFKQWGEWIPSDPQSACGNPRSGWMPLRGNAKRSYPKEELYPENGAAFVEPVGKAKAGRLLDGVEHNGFPTRT
jgi:protein gp37